MKVHVGKYTGHELRDLSEEAVRALVEKWLPVGKANPKPTTDDRRLRTLAGLHFKDWPKGIHVSPEAIRFYEEA